VAQQFWPRVVVRLRLPRNSPQNNRRLKNPPLKNRQPKRPRLNW